MKFLLILAILLLGLMLMACGGGSEEENTPAPAVKTGVVHSTFGDLPAFYGSTDRGDA